jgi:4-amino-4-deoxy-L-arabinose transferase-like glycosyltransferase
MLPGVSFGDWAEMQWIPARLGVTHPTGYPLYVLVGKAFSLLPIGSLAYRADLLSAVAAAGAAATVVLIAHRLGARPLVAATAGLSLATTGTLWLEATFSEMNGLHLLLVGLIVHRALLWRAEQRDRDFVLGGLLCGLALANHPLAATVVPIVTFYVLIVGWRRLAERPAIVLKASVLLIAGLSLYALIPLRALAGPPAVYGSLLTWDGFSSLVTGAQFRGDMRFASVASLAVAWDAIPRVVGQLQDRSNLLFIAGGLVGGVVLAVRDRGAAALLISVAIVNVYFFANYLGGLDHYLLVTWMILAVWLAVAAEALIGAIETRSRVLAVVASALLLAVPLTIGAANWDAYDQNANHDGEEFAATVFASLPANAVLLTYWDALTNLSYVHCVDGRRPDLTLVAYDPAARVTCDASPGPLAETAQTRPVFALFPFEGALDPLRPSFDLMPGPTLALPYGSRGLDHSGVLYQLQPASSP